jgi:hypothetical protein
MNTWIWASLGAVIGLVAPLALRPLRRSEPGTAPETPVRAPPRPAPRAQKFHGVTIQPCAQPCPAALALADRRFLPEQAPALPLAGCDQRRCQCAYRHHADRRDADDRRSGWGSFGGFAPSIPGGNRRGNARDRRTPRRTAPDLARR